MGSVQSPPPAYHASMSRYRYRFKWEQESSRFFEKKRRKKLLFGGAWDGETSTAPFKKVFLLLFVHKKKPSSSLGFDLS
jgi:hypothetical protein